jgi:predicted nucleotidyltransferase
MMKNINNNKLLIGLAFLNNLRDMLHLRELERQTKLDIKTIHIETKQLLDMNILNFKPKGNMKLFFLKNTFETFNFIIIVETYKALKFINLHKKLKLMFNELSKLSDFLVFGSYASNTQTKDSDIDLVIFSNKNPKIKKTLNNYDNNIHTQFILFNEFKKKLKSKDPLAIEIFNNHVLFGKHKNFAEIIQKWIN